MDEMIYVGMGPWRSTTFSKDFDKCLENCYDKWQNNSLGWYILKMTKDQYSYYVHENYININECDIVWDEFHIAPTQNQIEFRKNIIFSKPLKSHK